jgi:hypothetical protein
MRFRYDTRHLPPQVQQIIRKKDENNKLLEKSSTSYIEKPEKAVETVYQTAIFMRLGHSPSNKYNGKETLKIYNDFCNKNHSVWFSTDSLATGMSEKRRAEFIGEIKNGNIVEIYFAIGKSSDGDNNIHFRAEVADIKTDGDGIPSPEKSLTPDEWKENRNKIWMKIKGLKPFKELTAKDFIVVSTKKVLADSISNSQFNFGYIKKK